MFIKPYWLGKGIVATGVERIAAQDPVDAQSQGFENIVLFKSLQSIAATTGCEATGRHHQRRQCKLVKADQDDKYQIWQVQDHFEGRFFKLWTI